MKLALSVIDLTYTFGKLDHFVLITFLLLLNGLAYTGGKINKFFYKILTEFAPWVDWPP